MTLTIELTPEEQSALKAEAASSGLDVSEFVRRRLFAPIPEVRTEFRESGNPEEEEADERSWADRFARSGELLERMAAEADAERRNGRTIQLETILGES